MDDNQVKKAPRRWAAIEGISEKNEYKIQTNILLKSAFSHSSCCQLNFYNLFLNFIQSLT